MPTRKTLKSKIKTPRQARSKATVKALLDATARILVEVGYDRTSTNRVAKLAGVSIGSLYQYFPNKEALVAALMQRHTEEMSATVYGTLAEKAGAPIEDLVRALIHGMIAAHAVSPALHRILREQVPRTGELAIFDDSLAEMIAVLADRMQAYAGEVSVKDISLGTYICVQSCVAVVHDALHSEREEADLQALERELYALVMGYLRWDGRETSQ